MELKNDSHHNSPPSSSIQNILSSWTDLVPGRPRRAICLDIEHLLFHLCSFCCLALSPIYVLRSPYFIATQLCSCGEEGKMFDARRKETVLWNNDVWFMVTTPCPGCVKHFFIVIIFREVEEYMHKQMWVICSFISWTQTVFHGWHDYYNMLISVDE